MNAKTELTECAIVRNEANGAREGREIPGIALRPPGRGGRSYATGAALGIRPMSQNVAACRRREMCETNPISEKRAQVVVGPDVGGDACAGSYAAMCRNVPAVCSDIRCGTGWAYGRLIGLILLK